jgi:hypothetical protein
MPIWAGLTLASAIARMVGYAAALIAVGALVWWAAVVPRLELRDERADHAATKTDRAEMRARWAAELAEAHAKARAKERELQDAATAAAEVLNERKDEIDRRDRALAAARADARGLRDQLRAYAAAVRVPGDAGAACGSAAATLADLAADGGELLAEGADLLRQCAFDHDTAVAERDALIAAWPK